MVPRLPPIQPQTGRVFVYLIDAGPNILFDTRGKTDCCTVDKEMWHFLGECFWYVDLPEGVHRITVTDVFPSIFSGPKHGKHSVEFSLRSGEMKYCRIDLPGEAWWKPHLFDGDWVPMLVDTSVAEKEIDGLRFFKTHKRKLVVRDG
jgi:hypothetical protein